MSLYIKLIISYLTHLPHYILYQLSSNKSLIDEDIVVMGRNLQCNVSFINQFFLLLRDRFFRSLFYFRIGNHGKLLSIINPGEKSFFIDAEIRGGVYLAHPFSTIIYAKRIGKNLTIRQCTTIGNKKEGGRETTPIIGDNVNIGANVVIIGDIKIGNNVIIGAGSVVVHSIDDNCVVAGNPAKVIRTLKK